MMKKRVFAGLLVIALIFGMLGCQQAPVVEPVVTEPPATTAPAPDAGKIYADARAKLESASALTLDVVKTTTTTVEGQSFIDESQQVLTYTGLDTKKPMLRMEETVVYGTRGEEEEEKNRLYSEVFSDGKLYVELEDMAAFSHSMTWDECAQRYVPAVLLDAALYNDLSLETSGEQTTIHFTAPSEAESWALPQDAQMLEALGSAVVGKDGDLQQMNYTVSYQYGPAEVTLEVETKPREEALEVTAPEEPDSYTELEGIDALRISIRSNKLIKDAKVASSSSVENIISQAAGVVQSQSMNLDMYGADEDLMMKVQSDVFLSDPANGSQSASQEEVYRDGKYVITADEGLPTSQSGIKEDVVLDYCHSLLATNLAVPEFWKDVTLTDLGSTYLMEFDYLDDFGDSIQSAICLMFWNDATFLNKLASKYENEALSGYLSVDKYTGIITSVGVNYAGVHTIDGKEYTLSMRKDQSYTVPSFGAYSNITGELKEEAEPEEKATPLFYHVTGEDGQEMWLLGTIHVGDERTGFLPQEIYDAFAASDALALEVDSEAFEKQMEEDTKLQQKISKAYYYSDGSTIDKHLDAQVYTKALQYLKASGDYIENAQYMKPSLWQSSIEQFYLDQGHQLHSEQGVEERLTKLAKEQEKPIREVESGLEQTQMLTGWSEELQQLLLEDTLEYSAQEYWQQTYELYELWCAGDEEALRKELSSETELAEMTDEEKAEYEAMKPLWEEYDKAMNYDRNEGMLDVAIKYLRSGDVVFYAVGLAHLLDETNGLVDALRDAGYTVELVTYQ